MRFNHSLSIGKSNLKYSCTLSETISLFYLLVIGPVFNAASLNLILKHSPSNI